MKRNKPIRGIAAIFTFFAWRRCIHCHKEFRREPGWTKTTGPYYGGRGRAKQLCGACAPTIEAAEFLFDAKQKERMERPPAPPKPPLKRPYKDPFETGMP